MIKKEELKVGERVIITLEAVEQDGCDGCFFGVGAICYNPTMNGLVDGFNSKYTQLLKETKQRFQKEFDEL